jgi:hypothetical protein
MFKLSNQPAYFSHMNVRKEKHGDEEVGAIDLKFKVDLANERLDQLIPGLRVALFKEDPDGDLADGERLSLLRFPEIAPFPTHMLFVNHECRIHYGIAGKDIVLTDCKINSIQIECAEGGSIRMKFRVQALPSEEQVGRLYGLVKSEQVISVESEIMANTQHTI